MYSTPSSKQLTSNTSLVLTKSSPTGVAEDKESILRKGFHLAVRIEGSGASWEGQTEMFTRSRLQLTVEGCPLVVHSQSIQLEIMSSHDTFEVLGRIQKITPMGDKSRGKWSQVQLGISYDELDDLKWHRMKTQLGNVPNLSSSSFLRGTLVPLEEADSLWMLKPDQSSVHVPPLQATCVSDELETGEPRETSIVSTPVELLNPHGQLIRATYDSSPSHASPDSPVMVLSPGYGESKREYIMLAYYFASNGFHVLRYDHTNHVGISDGEHVNTTLSMMRDDLGAVVQYAEKRWPTSPRGIIATSLSGRVAIKAAAHDVDIDFLYLITPIVNVRQTLQAVHQEDLIAAYYNAEPKGVTNVLGFNVELDNWLADAVVGEYSDLETTYHDISRIQSSVIIVSAEHDAWVDMSHTSSVVDAFSEHLQQWMVIPRGLHRVLENPKQAKAVYRELVQCAHAKFFPRRDRCLVHVPTRKSIGRQNKIERDQKKVHDQPIELSGFWKDYLDNFHYIVNLSDYQQLLDHILHLLGPVQSGEKVLDAGCGNGNFGSFLLNKVYSKKSNADSTKSHEYQYVGIDFVPTALQHARKNYQASFMSASPTGNATNQQDGDEAYAFHCADLNNPLPFQDGTFDKVVSNLVLGYLESPANTIRELMRVLTPGGSLVLTNLKPNSDLSRIFTNFVQETSQTEEIDEARQLLSNSGKIREAEGQGIFQFPDAEELEELFRSVHGSGEIQIFHTFANQAYIVAVTKSAVQGDRSDVTPQHMLQAA